MALDQHAREEGYKFIRGHGPRSNNKNQFMEWTDEQVHLPGGKIEGWNEGKVKEALNNYYRGFQKGFYMVFSCLSKTLLKTRCFFNCFLS